jgi:glycosyl transferase, family 25
MGMVRTPKAATDPYSQGDALRVPDECGQSWQAALSALRCRRGSFGDSSERSNVEVYLINLDRSVDRLARFERLSTANSFTFIRISAVDGRALTEKDLAVYRSTNPKFYPLGPGEIGCFLSHRKAWQAIAANDGAYGAVFEDDVHIGKGVAGLLSQSNWIPDGTDIVKLETTLRPVTLSLEADPPAVGTRQLRRLWSRHGGTAGYVISRACCRALLADSIVPSDPLDQYMFNPNSHVFGKLLTYQLDPAICIQDENLLGGSEAALKSTLHDERRLHKPKGIRKLLREASRPAIRLLERLRARGSDVISNRERKIVEFQ